MNETMSELDLTREQLARVERALEAIRSDILPLNEKRYHLMAEGYIEQIHALRAQIDVYLGIESAAIQQSALVISLEGRKVHLGETAVGVMTRTLDAFRRGLQSLVEFTSTQKEMPRTRGRRKKWIEQLCDLPLIAIEPGCVQIVLGEPDSNTLFSDEERQLLRDNLNVFFSGLQWATREETEIPAEFSNNPELWHLVLKVLRTLIPPRNSPVEAIGFRGMQLNYREELQLQTTVRERLNQAIARPQEAPQLMELLGTIREVDLDKKTFTLRERPDGSPDLSCEYDEANEAIVISFLDEPVIVTGVLRKSPKTKKETVEVETIESDLSDESDSTTNETDASQQ